MKTNVSEILEKIHSDDFEVQCSGLDEAKVLIEHFVHESVDLMFRDSKSSHVQAERVWMMGNAVVEELTARINAPGQPEALNHAAYILFKLGSRAGLPLLKQHLDSDICVGRSAFTLAKAQAEGATEAITAAIQRRPPIQTQHDFDVLLALADSLSLLQAPLPAGVVERLDAWWPGAGKTLRAAPTDIKPT